MIGFKIKINWRVCVSVYNLQSNNGQTELDEKTEEVVTKPTLTGNPQIDYVWDPNLPRELNG